MLYLVFLFSLGITLIIALLPEKNYPSNEKDFGISVIIPAYNSEKTIIQCLQSILDTNYKNLEIIVVNDGSSDATAKKVSEFEKFGVKLINQRQRGKFAALNKGFEFSKKPIIFALDSDTFLAKNCFREIIRHFNEGVEVVIPKKIIANKKNNLSLLQYIHFLVASNYLKIQDKLNKFYFFGYPAIAVKREVWIKIGGFMDKIADDADFMLRIGECGFTVKYVSSAYVSTLAPESFKGFLSQNIRWSKGQLEMLFSHWRFLIKNIFWFLLIQPQLILGLIILIVYFYSLFNSPQILSVIINFVSIFFKNYKIILSFLEEYSFLGLYSGLPNLLINFLGLGIILSTFFTILLTIDGQKISYGRIFIYSVFFLPLLGMINLISYILVIKDLMIYHHIRPYRS